VTSSWSFILQLRQKPFSAQSTRHLLPKSHVYQPLAPKLEVQRTDQYRISKLDPRA